MDIGSADWNRLVSDGARELGIGLDAVKIGQFVLHARELSSWNRKINLTAIVDPEAMAGKHYLDSILPATMIAPASRLLDVGSGAGFPGIPLKIVLPTLSVTLIDSVRKKVSFLNHVIRLLALPKMDARHLRLQDCRRDERFDVIVSRAFSPLVKFVPRALPLLAAGGMIIAFKGRFCEARSEWEQFLASTLHPLKVDNDPVDPIVEMKSRLLPITGAERTLVVIKRRS